MINLEKNAPENPITHLPKLELGQKVTIKSLEWYDSNKDKNGAIKLTAETFVEEMAKYCGKTTTIVDAFKDLDGGSDTIMYRIALDHRDWNWTEEMFEPVNPITYLPKLSLGQKVTIKSLDWYNANKDGYNGIVTLTTESFVSDMSEYCGKTAIITDVSKDGDGEGNIMYLIDLDNGSWTWTDEMFEPERVEDVEDPEE